MSGPGLMRLGQRMRTLQGLGSGGRVAEARIQIESVLGQYIVGKGLYQHRSLAASAAGAPSIQLDCWQQEDGGRS